jgi:hypothetical protein
MIFSSQTIANDARKGVGRPTPPARETAILVLGSAFLIITFWIASVPTLFMTIAWARVRAGKTVHGVTAPPTAAHAR